MPSVRDSKIRKALQVLDSTARDLCYAADGRVTSSTSTTTVNINESLSEHNRCVSDIRKWAIAMEKQRRMDVEDNDNDHARIAELQSQLVHWKGEAETFAKLLHHQTSRVERYLAAIKEAVAVLAPGDIDKVVLLFSEAEARKILEAVLDSAAFEDGK